MLLLESRVGGPILKVLVQWIDTVFDKRSGKNLCEKNWSLLLTSENEVFKQ